MKTKQIIDFIMLRIKKKTLIFNINLTAWIIAAYAVLSFIFDLIFYDNSQITNSAINTGVFLFFALGFYLKSRVLSSILLSLHLLDILFPITDLFSSVHIASNILKIIFLIILIRGTKAIFIYHKIVKKVVKKANLDKTL